MHFKLYLDIFLFIFKDSFRLISKIIENVTEVSLRRFCLKNNRHSHTHTHTQTNTHSFIHFQSIYLSIYPSINDIFLSFFFTSSCLEFILAVFTFGANFFLYRRASLENVPFHSGEKYFFAGRRKHLGTIYCSYNLSIYL